MGARKKGREIALQILYQLEWTRDRDIDRAIGSYLDHLKSGKLLESDPAVDFVRRLVVGVLSNLDEIDAMLAGHARHWRLDRMALVDRNILRIGAYELCYCPDIPPKVAINEAVELGKMFGSDDSPSFVNGILDAVLRGRQGFLQDSDGKVKVRNAV